MTFREPELEERLSRDEAPDDRTPLLRRSSSNVSPKGTLRTIEDAGKDGARQLWSFATSNTGRGVLKCSLAYLLGSLATFVTPVAAFLGNQDGKHVVATVTVYFHPARSQGSMFEAIVLAFVAFIYALCVSFGSMGVSILFNAKIGLPTLGHAVVLVVFCGGGLGFVGWVKQRLGNPLVNVSCSLTSLAIITVLTKEGAVQAGMFSDDKIVQVMKMVLMGCLATTAVCFLISPISARRDLKITMIQVTDSFADRLALITRSFLSGQEEDLQKISSIKASDQHRSIFASLTKNLLEAKYEHYVMGTEREYGIEAKLVECMQRLAQSIGGLGSAASTQLSLLSQAPTASALTTTSAINSPIDRVDFLSPRLLPPLKDSGGLSPVDEAPEEGRGSEDTSSSTELQKPANGNKDLATGQLAAEIFTRFITQLGPSLVCRSRLHRDAVGELMSLDRNHSRILSNKSLTSYPMGPVRHSKLP